jgi:hypothetical protein
MMIDEPWLVLAITVGSHHKIHSEAGIQSHIRAERVDYCH